MINHLFDSLEGRKALAATANLILIDSEMKREVEPAISQSVRSVLEEANAQLFRLKREGAGLNWQWVQVDIDAIVQQLEGEATLVSLRERAMVILELIEVQEEVIVNSENAEDVRQALFWLAKIGKIASLFVDLPPAPTPSDLVFLVLVLKRNV